MASILMIINDDKFSSANIQLILYSGGKRKEIIGSKDGLQMYDVSVTCVGEGHILGVGLCVEGEMWVVLVGVCLCVTDELL